MAKYRRVTCVDRCHIFTALNSGIKISDIAKSLGFNKSTIYRELKRNSKISGYDPFSAEKQSFMRFQACRRKLKITGELEDLIEYLLFDGWSPEQISNRLKLERSVYKISHQSIYNFIRKLRTDLAVLLKRHNRRGAGRVRQQKINRKNRLTLSERPIEANLRLRRGDF